MAHLLCHAHKSQPSTNGSHQHHFNSNLQAHSIHIITMVANPNPWPPASSTHHHHIPNQQPKHSPSPCLFILQAQETKPASFTLKQDHQNSSIAQLTKSAAALVPSAIPYFQITTTQQH
jgi:hypothetical protein